jgi:hypothetical protein
MARKLQINNRKMRRSGHALSFSFWLYDFSSKLLIYVTPRIIDFIDVQTAKGPVVISKARFRDLILLG